MPLHLPARPLPRLAAREFLHPWPLLALLLLALNDHWFKGWPEFPRFLAGKLSDFAGLFYFPLLLTALWNTGGELLAWARNRPVSPCYPLTRTQLLVALAVTAGPYTAIKISGAAAAALAHLVSVLSGVPRLPIVDPTDLAALVMLPLAYLHGQRFVPRAAPPARPAD